MNKKPNDGDATGFSGLDSMLSDVDDAIANAPSPKPPEQNSRGHAFEIDVHAGVSVSKPLSKWTVAKWLFGIACVGLVIVVIANSKRDEVPAQPAAAAPEAALVPALIEARADSSQEPIAEQDMQAPPVGTGLMLNPSQIRYCLTEKIRIGLIKTVANQNSSEEVDAVNGMVSDYNSRCSQFRYLQSTFDGVNADVESRRAATEYEAKGQWARKHLSFDAPVRPSNQITPPLIEDLAPTRDTSQAPPIENVVPGIRLPSSQNLGVQSPREENNVRMPADSVHNN
ncbi:hypothetical protein ACVBEF_06500 [Glaciimonas sp. GG7]